MAAVKGLPQAWYDCLAVILSRVELDGVWPEGHLDAHGDSTPSGQKPLCVLPVIFRIWASVRLGHLTGSVQS